MGGESAPLTSEQSVSAMRQVIGGLRADDNGASRSLEGENVAW